ncbi:hypothetical protein ACH4VX_01125 [Streptomyces sp. NPDC020731]|uniref:hypothetical protein n=1 Tax=Streptomyces sp. NPDC020731 TaxID=3365085 RepID=UPI0037B28883
MNDVMLLLEHDGAMCLAERQDTGDAYGEDGYHGRGIAHPIVWNVPFAARVQD